MCVSWRTVRQTIIQHVSFAGVYYKMKSSFFSKIDYKIRIYTSKKRLDKWDFIYVLLILTPKKHMLKNKILFGRAARPNEVILAVLRE